MLELSIALSDNSRTRPLIESKVPVQGIDLITTIVHPSEMFWRQLRFGDFDISEMSLSSLFVAADRGDQTWVAVPVFTMRRFFHTGIYVRSDRGINEPVDLRGKRVGVPEYQQTSAVWSRGILEHEFGVKPQDIEWFMERAPDRSHGASTGFRPPAGVRLNTIPPSNNIGAMLISGELDAAIHYLNADNLVDRSRIDLSASREVRRLFNDPASEGRRYYSKTRLYPINHTLVVRRKLIEKHPWIALNLFNAFVAAKKLKSEEAAEVILPHVEIGLLPTDAKASLLSDPMPYGVVSAQKEIETIAQYVHEQGLTKRLVSISEVFAASVLDV
jgi:4,5-dihydroxyphthalate decarboxylase